MESLVLGGGSWACERCGRTIQGSSIYHDCRPPKITQKVSMNNIDKQYQALLQDILDNGVRKGDRTGTGTISVFGRQIRHKMSEGFPLLTTKKMAWKTMVTELLWFLRGDTNIKYLVENGCHIWDGDAYKNYLINHEPIGGTLTREEFIELIKQNEKPIYHELGELGPIYGKQWRAWEHTDKGNFVNLDNLDDSELKGRGLFFKTDTVDQIANLIHDLKTNPDSRRLMVSAWNVGEIDSMVLPPCHYGFQVWTRELTREERKEIYEKTHIPGFNAEDNVWLDSKLKAHNIPTRAISLMWNQRSVDTFLGLPFNIASYALLLEIIAKEVNMIPDELIGNLGDTHLYSNHIEQAREQIGREPMELPTLKFDGWLGSMTDGQIREEGFLNLIQTKILPSHFQIENYKSHPAIKAPLSN